MSGDFPDRAVTDDEGRIIYSDEVVEGNPLGVTPAAVASDARKRALRTFLQGLGFDVLVAVVLTLYPLVGSADSDWTTLDAQLLGLSVAKTVVVTIFAFVMRRFRIVPATL